MGEGFEFPFLVALNLAAIAALLYYRRVHTLKAKQAALEAFSRKLIDSQEVERKRIATELHDSLGQSLMVIKNQALVALRQNPGASRDCLEEISATASQAIDEVRAIAYALRPYQLDRLGLKRAVESMLKKVSDSTGLQFTSRLDPLDDVLAKDSEISLYRIVQEGVNNILRHSKATMAEVEIHRDVDFVSITIADNGVGFAFDPGQTGLGLAGITERARLLGGTSQIVSAPGAGTSITIRIHCGGAKDGRRSDGAGGRRSSDLSEGAVAGSGG
jgi:signal transduction histidine kinase